nr:MAG TPA: hypothetical protein [Caudoviricetes sp.]
MLSILFLFSCQFRTWFEFNNFLCSNLDRLFSRGVDTHTRSSFHHTESSKTNQ